MTDPAAPMLIDGLQFCRWSREIFEQMRAGGLSAVHATVAYHETFRKTVELLVDWNRRFEAHEDLILMARDTGDIDRARATGRTAILFGLQTPMPIEDDLGLVEMLHTLGIRFIQLTYNNQSLLGCGWTEAQDSGLTRMGRLVIAEMNRMGLVIDMSHAGERTTLEAIDASNRPVAITHANPSWWPGDQAQRVEDGAEGAGRDRRDAGAVALPDASLPQHRDDARGVLRHGGRGGGPDRGGAARHRVGSLPGPAGRHRALDA